MAIITISRLYGIGGREFGYSLANALGYEYVDKELLGYISEKSGSSEEAVSLYEGMTQGPSKLFRDFLHRKYPGTRPEIMDPAHYIEVLRAVLEELALRGGVVIVGRGGQCILGNHPRALHFRLLADRRHIVQRLAALPRFADVPEAEIWRRSESYRESRRRFVQQHFGCDIENPMLYHLVMNISRLQTQEAVAIIIGMVNRIEGKT